MPVNVPIEKKSMLDKSHKCAEQVTVQPCPVHQGLISDIVVITHIIAGMGWTHMVLKSHGI